MSGERSEGPQSLVCLTTSAAAGGAETSLLTLLNALRRQEPSWEIAVVAPASGPVVERCEAINLKALVLPYPDALRTLGETDGASADAGVSTRARFVAQAVRAAATLPGYLSGLRRILRERGATIVHSNGVKAHIAASLAKPAGVSLVWHLHDYVQARPLSAKILRRLVHRTEAIVATSDSVRCDASAALGSSASVRRVYNAVDLEAFGPDGRRADLARLAGMRPDEGLVRVGLVGTFARWKGQDVFIDAMARMRRRDRVRGYIVGDAVYETLGSQWTMDELRALVTRRGLTDVIGFTGHVRDVPPVLRSLDVMVHASTSPEPFGMVIAEGMASGRAVVAAAAGGASELFEDRISGVAHAPGDSSQLADRLDELVTNADWRSRLGAAARAAARRGFGADRMAAEFRQVYLG